MTTKADIGSIGELMLEFSATLRAQRRSPLTITGYGTAVKQFDAFLTVQGMPRDIAQIKREHVEAFIVGLIEKHSASTAATRFRALQQFFRWAQEEGEVPKDRNPMANMKAPAADEKVPAVLSADQVKLLIKACTGQTFEDRRDTALLLLLLDSGLRRSEAANLTVDDLDMETQVAVVMGKGRRQRVCPFGSKTAQALFRYLRARRAHRYAGASQLWIGRTGPFDHDSIYHVLVKRAEKAGIGHVHPHQLRHTFADAFLSDGGNETDLMRLAGWKSRDMLSRYAASTGTDRAIKAHRQHGPVDRLL